MHDGVRAILLRLRPPSLGRGGVDAAVKTLCEQWSTLHPDIRLNCHIEAPPRAVAAALQLTVHRLLQEGLTNVVRHAGASEVEVALHCSGDSIELRITDDGCGLAGEPCKDSRPRYGLTGMQERTLAFGGDLRFETAPRGGLCVCATLPLDTPMETTT
jgi:two-component system sensor histidine kinase UhpB